VLSKRARKLRKTITKLVTKRNMIYLRRKTTDKAHILRFLNKKIKKSKKQAERVFAKIEQK
jgi:hypothetical protein